MRETFEKWAERHSDGDPPEEQEELERLRKAFPTCDKHTPTGGARSGCVICSAEKLQYALSRIDYALSAPNEMELSGYDTDYDEERVVRGVEQLRAENTALKEKLK